jgi:hypothetical protein
MIVSDAISQGQVQASGSLIDPQDGSKSRGRAVVRFVFDDDVTSYQLPAGSSGQVAVYTDHMAALAIIRRILLRMKSWLNYVV